MLKKAVNWLGWDELKETAINYNVKKFRSDFWAGILVSTVAFPSVMAFAILAGLSPEHGLYSFIIAALIGTFVGSSFFMIMGPTNVIALLIAGSLTALSTGSNPMTVVLVLTFLVGVIQIALSLLNFGKLSGYISKSVITGLMTGVAFVIASGQIVRVLGIELAKEGSALYLLYKAGANLDKVNFYPFFIAVFTILVVFLIRKISDKIPAYFFAIVLSGILVSFFDLGSELSLIGSFEGSFPQFTFPDFLAVGLNAELLSFAFAIAMLCFIEVVTITEFKKKGAVDEREVEKDFLGLGIINIFCSFFNGFAGGGSFTRSFANYQAGAKTRFAQLIAGVFTLLLLFFLSPLIAGLPIASLGAILIIIAFRMVDPEKIKLVLKTTHFDALIFIITFLSVILISRLDYAVYLAVLFSLILVIKDTSDVNYSYLKIKENEVNQASLSELKEEDQIIIDFSGMLHFNAVQNLKKDLEEAFEKSNNFVIRMRSVEEMDITTISQLEEFIDEVRKKGGDVFFSGVSSKINDELCKYGLIDKLGEGNCFTKEKEFFSASKKAIKKAKKNGSH